MSSISIDARRLSSVIESCKLEQAEQWRVFFEREKNEEYRQASLLRESNELAREALGLNKEIK